MQVRELVTKIGFDVDQNKLNKAETGFSKLTMTAGSLASKFTIVGTAVAGAVATIGVAVASVYAAGNALFSVVKNFADIGDNAIKTSQQIGVNVESFQRLSYAAGLAGTSQENMANSLKFLSKNLIDASEGGLETSEAFAKLGIDPKKHLQDTEGLLYLISDRIAAMPDGAKKTEVSLALMGRAGSELIPFLNQGSKAIKEAGKEAELFGLIIREKATRQSEEFNDNLSRLSSIFLGLKTTLGNALLPAFANVVQSMVAWYKNNAKFIKSGIDRFFEKIVPLLDYIGQSIASIFGGEGKDATEGFIKVMSALALAFEAVIFVLSRLIKGLEVWVNSGIGQAIIKMFKESLNIVFLLIDDLLAFFRGDNSLTGEIVKAGKEIVSMWTNLFGSLFEFLKAGFMETVEIAKQLANPLTAFGAIGKIRSGEAFSGSTNAFSKVNSSLNQIKGTDDKSLLSSFNIFKRAIENIQSNKITGKSSASVLPASSSSLSTPTVENKNIKATGNFNITVPASSLTEEIKKAVSRQWDVLIRQADQANGAAAV